MFELHDRDAPTVLAETTGAEADVLPVSVTGPEMLFELSTTAPVAEVIVTGPSPLLPSIATARYRLLTSPGRPGGQERRPTRPAHQTQPDRRRR